MSFLILKFCGPPKKRQTAALRKLYMCQEFTIFEMPWECYKVNEPLRSA